MNFILLSAIFITTVSCSKTPLTTVCNDPGSQGFALGEGYLINQNRRVIKTTFSKDKTIRDLKRQGWTKECPSNSDLYKFSKVCAGKDSDACIEQLLKPE